MKEILKETEEILKEYNEKFGWILKKNGIDDSVLKEFIIQIRQEGYEIENKVRKEFKDKGFFNDGVEEGRQQVIEENREHYSNFIIDEHKIRQSTLSEVLKMIDEVYKKEKGINNWLDLREKIKK